MVFDPSVDSNWLGISLSHFICLCVFNTTHSSFNHLTAESCRLPKGGHMFFVQIQQSIFLLYHHCSVSLCVCVCVSSRVSVCVGVCCVVCLRCVCSSPAFYVDVIISNHRCSECKCVCVCV